jgi:hypothetical protein
LSEDEAMERRDWTAKQQRKRRRRLSNGAEQRVVEKAEGAANQSAARESWEWIEPQTEP